MTEIPSSRHPLPVEVTDFDFLSSPSAPTHAVLEFRTRSNPVRLFLTKAQIELLASKAKIAALKIQD